MSVPPKIRVEPYGALVYFPSTATTVRLSRIEAELLGCTRGFDGPAPEVVHCELTSKCNMSCFYCYCAREQVEQAELNTEQWKKIFRDLATCGVLQLAFGGGEPLLREDVFELAEYANVLGMSVAMTTNGRLVRDGLFGLFKQVNISYHGDLEVLKRSFETLRRWTRVGVNFIVRADTLPALPALASFCKQNDIELLLLSYKPIAGDVEQVIPSAEVLSIAYKLACEGVKVAVDALTYGLCWATDRFAVIGSNGDVYPCSFVRTSMGNALSGFREVWEKRRVPKCPWGGSFGDGERVKYNQ